MKNRYKQWFQWGLLFLLLTGFMMLFSVTTSPIFDNLYGYDSAYYRFIGSAILRGKIPYVDLFENKGPFFYFIQAVGALNGTQNRKISLIFPMQVLSLCVTIFFCYKSGELLNPTDKRESIRFILLVVCALSSLAATLQGGNITEDWSFPMISCSLFLFTKYAINIKEIHSVSGTNAVRYSHPPRYAFIHGICFGMIALIRINNAISICAGLFVIGILLIMHRQWKNILQNILSGFAGILLVALPIFGWYLSKNAMDEMIYAAFIHAFKYSQTTAHSDNVWSTYGKQFIPLITSLLLVMIHALRTKKVCFIDIIVVVIILMNFLFFLKFNSFLHYFAIIFPVFLYSLALYVDTKARIEWLLIIFIVVCFIPSIRESLYWSFLDNTYPIFPTADKYVPKKERDSMIAIDTTPAVYLIKGMMPVSRFAVWQTSTFDLEPEFKDEFITDLQTKKPKWIVKTCEQTIKYTEIQKIIDDNYSQNFMDTSYCFYRRNE